MKFMDDTLVIFDMDDTLIAHDPWHLEQYIRLNGHSLDDSTGFSTVYRSLELFKKGTPIKGMISLLNKLDSFNYNTIIVTARDKIDDIEGFYEYMRELGIYVPVHFAGANKKHEPSKNKFTEISNILNSDKYSHIDHLHMFDDSLANIQMMNDLRKKFPHIDFYGHHFNL